MRSKTGGNWTPGPWEALFNGWNNTFVTTQNKEWIAEINLSRDNSGANAHLIAAAPEMYEALKEVLAEASSPSFDDERLAYVEVQMSKRTLEDIRKAVAKAEGSVGDEQGD